MDQFVPVEYDKWFTIDENIDVQYTDTGHIIGSAAVHLKIKENPLLSLQALVLKRQK